MCEAAVFWEPTAGTSTREFVYVTQLKSVAGNKQHVCGFCCITCIYFRKKGMETESETERKRENERERQQALQPMLRLSSTHNPIE